MICKKCGEDKPPKVLFRNNEMSVQKICKDCFKTRAENYALKHKKSKKGKLDRKKLEEQIKKRQELKEQKLKESDEWKRELMEYIIETQLFTLDELVSIKLFIQRVDELSDY